MDKQNKKVQMSIYKYYDSVAEKDLQKVIDFLKVAWNPDHALVKSKALMDFQHYDREKREYHFIVAENQMTGEYDALVGYIPTSQYDRALEGNGDYWGAIWKRRDDVKNAEVDMIGSDVFQRLFGLPHFQSECGISLSKYAEKACRALRYTFGYMHQYYVMNAGKNEYAIAANVRPEHKQRPQPSGEARCEMRKIDLGQMREGSVEACYRPQKSVAYLVGRYQRHPIYRYDFWGVYEGEKLRAVLVTRAIRVGESRVLRIVDALGRLGGDIYDSLQSIVQEGGYEYADFMNYGIPSETFRAMGFNELDFENDTLILPNYYEPFLQENIKMTVVFKGTYKDYVAFKGDSDQDRPNII